MSENPPYDHARAERELVAQHQAPAVHQPAAALAPHPSPLAGLRLTGAEAFWYVLGCIAAGGMYFAKLPAKKALAEVGLGEMTVAGQFWYVVMCIAFGGGYFAKVPVKKALVEAGAIGPRH